MKNYYHQHPGGGKTEKHASRRDNLKSCSKCIPRRNLSVTKLYVNGKEKNKASYSDYYFFLNLLILKSNFR